LISAGALPHTPLGELTALPDSLAGFQGSVLVLLRKKKGEEAGKKGKEREKIRNKEKKREGIKGKRGRKVEEASPISGFTPLTCFADGLANGQCGLEVFMKKIMIIFVILNVGLLKLNQNVMFENRHT